MSGSSPLPTPERQQLDSVIREIFQNQPGQKLWKEEILRRAQEVAFSPRLERLEEDRLSPSIVGLLKQLPAGAYDERELVTQLNELGGSRKP